MLIEVIDPVESAKTLKRMTVAFGARLRPKLERLEVFDLIGVDTVHPLMDTTVLPFLFVGNDWKVDHLQNVLQNVSVRGFDAFEMAQGELPTQMIQGATKVVRRVPDDEPPVVGDIYDVANSNDDAPLFSLVLSPERDRTTVGVNSLNLDPEGFYVRFSAFELCPGTGKV